MTSKKIVVMDRQYGKATLRRIKMSKCTCGRPPLKYPWIGAGDMTTKQLNEDRLAEWKKKKTKCPKHSEKGESK